MGESGYPEFLYLLDPEEPLAYNNPYMGLRGCSLAKVPPVQTRKPEFEPQYPRKPGCRTFTCVVSVLLM